MDKPKLWTKDFLINTTINFFIYLVFYSLLVVIAVYAINTLHASPSEAGLASGIFIVGALLARIFAGRSIEQIGRKKTLYIGLFFFLLTTFAYFGATRLEFLYGIRFLQGLGFGISATAAATIVTGFLPKDRHGEGISYFALSITLATAIGPFFGLYLNQYGNFNLLLGICVMVLIIACIATSFLKVTELELTEEQLVKNKQFSLDNFFEFRVLPIAIVGVFVGVGYSCIASFLAVYTQEINLIPAGSFFFIVYAVVILISRPVAGRLLDKKGQNFVMYPAFVLFAIGLGIISQAHQSSILLLGAVFVGFGFGTFMSSIQAIAVIVSPPHRMGLATSTLFIMLDASMGFGPFVIGFLIPVIGYRGLYLSMAFLVMASMFLYYLVWGRIAHHGKPGQV
jgi:MFS family permease